MYLFLSKFEAEYNCHQRWSRGHKARGQRQGHKKKSEAKDNLSEDRHSRGQGQECSRPRPRTKDTSASALQKKKKKRSSQKFFKQSPQKNAFQKIFQPLHKILTIQKIVLSSSRGQANFRGLEASRPRPRTSKCVLEDSTSDCHIDSGNFNEIKIIKILVFHQICLFFMKFHKFCFFKGA